MAPTSCLPPPINNGRIASTRNPEWFTSDKCQLCFGDKGTLLHRHHCQCVLQKIGPEVKAIDCTREEIGMCEQRKNLWRTRGIGAFRIFPHAVPQTESLRWIKALHPAEDESALSWFIDASQLDDDHDRTRVFGFGIVAVTEHGRLAAAASGCPPPYVSTIGQAEAHALAIVLESTSCRKAIFTDCLSNVRLAQGGSGKALTCVWRSARTWQRISMACDGELMALPLKWVPAHRSWEQTCRDANSAQPDLTPLQWQCNRAVDALAKQAAFSIRSPDSLRSRIAPTRNCAMHYRCWLGAVT